MVFAGNCHAATLTNLFQRTSAIADDWSISWFDPGAKGEARDRQLDDVRRCDVLIKQDIANVREHDAWALLRPNVTEFRIPFYYYGALWPFDAWQNGPDPASGPDLPANQKFAYRDFLLGQFRSRFPDPEERFRHYRDLDVPVAGVKDIDTYAAYEERRLHLVDRLTGCTSGAFILENARKRRLFHTVTHPTLEFSKHQCEDIFRMLGFNQTAADINYRSDDLAYYQVPLHPAVIRKLGVAWADDDTTYIFWRTRHLTWESYVRGYIEMYG